VIGRCRLDDIPENLGLERARNCLCCLISSARTHMLESRNAELSVVLTGLGDIMVLRNGEISVSDQTILLISVGDNDLWTLLLISQKGKLRDVGPRSLRDVID